MTGNPGLFDEEGLYGDCATGGRVVAGGREESPAGLQLNGKWRGPLFKQTPRMCKNPLFSLTPPESKEKYPSATVHSPWAVLFPTDNMIKDPFILKQLPKTVPRR